jgi:hypothetical protein
MNFENLDSSIVASVTETVEKYKQSSDLANRILSWLDAIHSGQVSLDDRNAYLQRIEVLLDATKVKLEDHGN